MPEPARAPIAAEEKKAAPAASPSAPAPAVRLRKYIDLVIEDKLSFALFRAVAVDFSATGMRIITDQYLAKNTKYTITMKQQPMLTLRGDIRWIKPAERDTFQCGVLFLDVSPEDRERLDRFIAFESQRTAHPPAPTTPAS